MGSQANSTFTGRQSIASTDKLPDYSRSSYWNLLTNLKHELSNPIPVGSLKYLGVEPRMDLSEGKGTMRQIPLRSDLLESIKGDSMLSFRPVLENQTDGTSNNHLTGCWKIIYSTKR